MNYLWILTYSLGSWFGEGMTNQMVEVQFPQIHHIDRFGKLYVMYPTLIIYHLQYVVSPK